jgi:hypothetical protein
MHSYFSRHEVDKKGKGFSPGEDGFPSAGRIAWALWGGDAGQVWAAKKVEQINRNRKLKRKEKAVAHMKRDDHGRVMGFELKAEIVLPTPEADEELEDFIDRAVVDETMELEYPDENNASPPAKHYSKNDRTRNLARSQEAILDRHAPADRHLQTRALHEARQHRPIDHDLHARRRSCRSGLLARRIRSRRLSLWHGGRECVRHFR